MPAKQEKDRTSGALEAARERTLSAYETARSRASEVTRQASDQLSVYPVAVVVGGFLVGALAASLVPRTEREVKALGRTGRKVVGAARDAAQRGLDAGKEQIETIRERSAQKIGEAVADVVAGKH